MTDQTVTALPSFPSLQNSYTCTVPPTFITYFNRVPVKKKKRNYPGSLFSSLKVKFPTILFLFFFFFFCIRFDFKCNISMEMVY